MAIEIVKLGQLPEEQKISLVCADCKTEFTCLRPDMTFSSDRYQPGYFINCPLCSAEVRKSPRPSEGMNNPYGKQMADPGGYNPGA